MDVHMYGVDLVSVIFQSVFAYDTPAPPQVSWCGGARYIAQFVNPVLLAFLRQEGDVLFQ